MLDAKMLRNHWTEVTERLSLRSSDMSLLERFPAIDQKRRDIIQEVEALKNKRNQVSKEVSQLKKEKKDAEHLIIEMREVNDKIKTLDESLNKLEEEQQLILLSLPNLPHQDVPIGASEDQNVLHSTWGDPTAFGFEAKAHWELGEQLGIIDFESAGKVTGSRFVFLKGDGAKLERALINFMLDLHTAEHGYQEMLTPFIVNRDSMVGTGQLPKFEEDAFKLDNSDYFLIPTTEVPLTNYHRDDILDVNQLPIAYTGYSANFRSEAGSAGRDTRGLIRQHQFDKVELVRFVKPEESYDVLEALTGHAEKVLQLLKLPYRKVTLCTGDLGFASAKTYDLEVWLPSYKTYREISSCSNFEDFQARRANIRFRRDAKAKPEFLHTLNGSGLAVGRTLAAILENYQEADGRVKIPDALKSYMGNREYIG